MQHPSFLNDQGVGNGARRWSVLVGCFVGMAVCMSSLFTFPLGLYMKGITAEFGWSRTEFSATLSLIAICNLAAVPLAGWAVDRFGPLRCIAVGLVVGGAATASLAFVSSYTAFATLSCLATMSGSLGLYPAYFVIIRSWFDRNLGLALAIATAGVSLGVAGFAYFIEARIRAGGWRSTFIIAAAVATIIGLANLALLLRVNKGSLPTSERARGAGTGIIAGLSLIDALRRRDFWLFSLAFALVVFVNAGPNLHLPALVEDRGGSSASVATAVAAVGLGSLFGRLASGLLLDRLSVRVVGAVFFLAQGVGVLMLWDHFPWTPLATFLMGTAQGAEIDMMGYVMARRFGNRAYARIVGSSFAISQCGLILSPVGMAFVFDKTGSYDIALLTYPLMSVAALLLIVGATSGVELVRVGRADPAVTPKPSR